MAEAKKDARIVGIHAAMGGGTGMNRFEKVCVVLCVQTETPCVTRLAYTTNTAGIP